MSQCCTPLPCSRLHQLANLALHQVALQGAEMADVELAVEVVGLMQKCAGEQLFASFLKPLAFEILSANRYCTRTRDRLPEFGNTEAAFILCVLALGMNDFRVDQHELRVG